MLTDEDVHPSRMVWLGWHVEAPETSFPPKIFVPPNIDDDKVRKFKDTRRRFDINIPQKT